MSETALETLRRIFSDRPDLLEIINLRDLESEKLVGNFRKNNELFAAPVNLYVTGRTGAGKTSLGNRLLEQSVMESTGYQDCTDGVGYFRLASNLHYYDLPGAGSSESYENINRAALLMPQIKDEDSDPPITPISQFKVKDFSDFYRTGVTEKKFTVLQWKSPDKQQEVAPDVILYVIAPNMQFLNSDRKYLRQLLETQEHQTNRNRVIFALNLFRRNGQCVTTQQNLDDVRKHITQLYQRFYQDTPLIVEFDALTGYGINEITTLICQVLPKEKLGNIQQVLRTDLKQFAQKERSIRYLQTLIKIASRLANYKVDQKAGNQDLLQVAASAISTYGVKTFKNQDELAQIKAELNDLIEIIVRETKTERTKDVKVKENLTDTKEITKDVPIIEEKKITDYIEVTEARVKPLSSFKKAVNLVTSFLGVKIFDEKLVNETVRKPIERLETRLVGYEQEVIGTVEVVVGQIEKIVGKEYLNGGYPVIKFLLGLGLAIEAYCSNPNRTLDSCLEQAEVMLERQLIPVKDRIVHLVESEASANVEKELIHILEQALI